MFLSGGIGADFMRGAIALARKPKPDRAATYGRMVSLLREAERSAPHGGTGATIVKLQFSPIAQLLNETTNRKNAKKPVDGEKFGSHELQAAQEIETAFFALSGGQMFKPLSMERLDRGRPREWPEALAMKVRRYQKWAGHWSVLAKQCDPTLQIVIAAVIDQRGIREIAADLGFGHERIRHAIVRGLRDYAARAGWVSGRFVTEWKAKAGQTFHRAVIRSEAIKSVES